MASAQPGLERNLHPVDIVEHLAAIHDWAFDRSDDDEINISVKGAWTEYHVSFTWHDDLEALHLACAFDVPVPDNRRNEVCRLIAFINEQLWLGHFDLWSGEGMLMYRQGLLLSGGAEPSSDQCESMLRMATETCERYFQTFQFVLWAGKSAEDAMQSSLFETVGEA